VEITEVRIKLMEDSEDRLRAFCSITLDGCFVVRDLKIIEGSQGPFVAMPSRKLTGRCHRCSHKNHLRSHYCNQCGTRLRESRESRDDEGQGKLYADVAHPINQACRDLIQARVVEEYTLELERAKQPGYVSRYDESYEPHDLSSLPVAANPASETRGRSNDSASQGRYQSASPSAAIPAPHLTPRTAADSPSATTGATPGTTAQRQEMPATPSQFQDRTAAHPSEAHTFPDESAASQPVEPAPRERLDAPE